MDEKVFQESDDNVVKHTQVYTHTHTCKVRLLAHNNMFILCTILYYRTVAWGGLKYGKS